MCQVYVPYDHSRAPRPNALIQQVLLEHELILKDPPPSILFSDFGDSALIFEAIFWCRVVSGERDLRVIRSDVRFRIDALFNEHGITIAFPQLDLHIKSMPNRDAPVAENTASG